MENTIVNWGYVGMDKNMETTMENWGYLGILEKTMETTIVYWGYRGIMERNMETTLKSYALSIRNPKARDKWNWYSAGTEGS